MPTEIWTAIISGVAGLAAGSAVTAWANWGIEKRRMARQRTYDLLDSWRTGIASIGGRESTDVPETPWYDTPWYDTLRQYLSDDTRRGLEKPRTAYVSTDTSRSPIRNILTAEVDRIEREWKLRP